MRSGLFLELYCLDCKFVLRNNLAWMENDLAHSCKVHSVPYVKETWEKQQLEKYRNALLCFYLHFVSLYQFKIEIQRRKSCIKRCRMPYYHILYCIRIPLPLITTKRRILNFHRVSLLHMPLFAD
jgi:hypothetical protein